MRMKRAFVASVESPKPRGIQKFVLFLATLKGNVRGLKETRDEEAMLDENHAPLPVFWARSAHMLASNDATRSTHAAEMIAQRMLYRQRSSEILAERMVVGMDAEQSDGKVQATVSAHNSRISRYEEGGEEADGYLTLLCTSEALQYPILRRLSGRYGYVDLKIFY